MLPPSYRATFVFVVLLTLILTYPMPVSSLPIVALKDRISHASNSSYADDQLVFDVSFTLVLLITLLITFLWVFLKMTIDLFNAWVNLLLVAFIFIVEEVVNQLSYLTLDTLFRPAIYILVDANDFIRDFNRPMDGLPNLISTTARFAPQSQRPPMVIPPGYGIRPIDINDRSPPPLRRLRSTPPVQSTLFF